MNTLIRLLSLATLATTLSAAEDPALPALRAADAERTAATVAADPARLASIFSDGLRYAHATGKIDDKASYTASLVTHGTVYESFEYVQRDFQVISPEVALMSGRVLIHAGKAGQVALNDLNFLAVWRKENGRWRFLSWQSCKNPPATK